MAHDFAKQRAARANRSARPAPAAWLWLATGVVIGTLISFLVYLATLAPQPQPAAVASGAAPGDEAPAEPDDKKDEPAPAPQTRPEFDYYEILRNSGGSSAGGAKPASTASGPGTGAAKPVDVPEPGRAASAGAPPSAAGATTAAAEPAAKPPDVAVAPPAPKPPEAARPAGLATQAGAFSQRADADRRRGEIVLLGYDARIDAVKLPDGQTRYRVVVGPFADPQALANARRALRDVGIETM